MDNFWKGMFVPFSKHVDSVTYIRFEDMKREDWLIFDYPNLLPAARRAVQDHFGDCSAQGFYRVKFDQHIGKYHGGKPVYYHLTRDEEGREFSEEQAHEEFGNFKGYDADVELDDEFEFSYLEEMAQAINAIRTVIAGIVAKAYKTYMAAQQLQSAQQQQQEQTEEERAEQEERERLEEERLFKKIEAYLMKKYKDWPKWAVVLLVMRYKRCGVPESVLKDIEKLQN